MGAQTGEKCMGRSSELPRDIGLSLCGADACMIRECWRKSQSMPVTSVMEVTVGQMGKWPGRNCQLEFGVT